MSKRSRPESGFDEDNRTKHGSRRRMKYESDEDVKLRDIAELDRTSVSRESYVSDSIMVSDDERSPEPQFHQSAPPVDRTAASTSKARLQKKSTGSKYNLAWKKYTGDLSSLGRLSVPGKAMELIDFLAKEWEKQEEKCKALRKARGQHIAKAKEATAKFTRANLEKKAYADSTSQLREQIKTVEGINQDFKTKIKTMEARELEQHRWRRNWMKSRTEEGALRTTLKQTKAKLKEASQNLTACHTAKEELQECQQENLTLKAEITALKAEAEERHAYFEKKKQKIMAAVMEDCEDEVKSEQDTI